MNKIISRITRCTLFAACALSIASCQQNKFHVSGNITDAKDSVLYFENMSLDGPVVLDSVKLGEDGAFDFSGDAVTAPEFFRLRIARNIINVSIDSTETVEFTASYPTMAVRYEVKGSDNCEKIKELSILQNQLLNQAIAIEKSPVLSIKQSEDSIESIVEAYKDYVKRNYIFKEPGKAYSYFALFQALGNRLIFNPRSSHEDIRVFAAVATSWDAFYPNAERGANLHNIAIEGMKEVRMLRSKAEATIDASKLNTTGVLNFTLTDNHGAQRSLASLKGNVVMLDFHVFATGESMKRIMMLRELYNKYHAQGFEIYQVSLDEDEHFWKTQTSALPWVSTRLDDNSQQVLRLYNVQQVPTFFLLDRNCNVVKRDAQITDLDAEIKALL